MKFFEVDSETGKKYLAERWAARFLFCGFATIILGLLWLLPHARASTDYRPRPRFEMIYSEDHSSELTNKASQIETWHDKETGIEFVCLYNGKSYNVKSISCFTAGRRWTE